MSMKALAHAWKAEGLTPLQKLVLLYLSDSTDWETYEAAVHDPDSKALATFCCATEDDVEAALAQLAGKGKIRLDLSRDRFEYLFDMTRVA